MLTFLADGSLVPLLVIVGMVVGDLLLRLLAFGRLESIAVDVALFSAFYCLGEVVGFFVDAETVLIGGELKAWMIKLAFTVFCWVVLSVVHRGAAEDLSELVRVRLQEAVDRSTLPDAHRLINALRPVVSRSVLVSFTPPEGRLRAGKQRWRSEVAKLVNEVAQLEGVDQFVQEDFSLPYSRRVSGLVLFGALGGLSVLVVAWPV